MSTQKSRTVYVIVNKQVSRDTYHTDRDCQHIRDARVREVEERLLHDDVTLCQRCEGDQPGGGRWEESECPLCGETMSDLAVHLPDCPSR